MRVIAGTARSLKLKTIDGMSTRPTTDRIKETLFNIINNDLYDCRFLDLFSGSGGIGIEALSRGAAHCDFVENNRNCVSCIKDNLKFTKLEDRSFVHHLEVNQFLSSNNGKEPYDIIFLDPPYRGGFEYEILKNLKNNSICDKDTLIIIEALSDSDFSYLDELGFELNKKKVYGSNMHLFLHRR